MGNTGIAGLKSSDLDHMRRAAECAMDTYNAGNCAVGAVITLGEERIAEGGNSMIEPQYNPILHAEMTTIGRVPVELWTRAREMTCYTTLEPCVMCTTALLMHGFGRVVYGSADLDVGGSCLLPHLPPYYEGGRGVYQWIGPVLPEVCDPLRALCHERFAKLPIGIDHLSAT